MHSLNNLLVGKILLPQYKVDFSQKNNFDYGSKIQSDNNVPNQLCQLPCVMLLYSDITCCSCN